MLAVAVTPASVQDRDQIAPLLREVRRLFPFLERAIADSGYRGATTAATVKKSARLPLEIVKRSDTAMGFVVLPKRWIVERTFGWLGRCRRLAKDFENLACASAPVIDPFTRRSAPARTALPNCPACG